MKVKSKFFLLSCMSIVSISAIAIETEGIKNRPLERVTANDYQHGGWDQQHVNSTLVGNLSSHDDIVGARNDGEVSISNNYNTPVNVITRPGKNGAPINCKHPSYVALCAELAKLTAPPPPPPPPPPPVYGWVTIYNSSSKASSINVPSSMSKYSKWRVWGKYEYYRTCGSTSDNSSCSGGYTDQWKSYSASGGKGRATLAGGSYQWSTSSRIYTGSGHNYYTRLDVYTQTN